MARHFPEGVTLEAIGDAPALTFNQKDRLQSQWVSQTLGDDVPLSTHWLPSTQSFVDASLSGMGWGMNPIPLVREHLKSGRLVELIPDTPLDVAIYWQISRFAADRLAALTRVVVVAARGSLHNSAPPPGWTASRKGKPPNKKR
jgi:LysR family transcriptional regulator (chromosome initiation inhibitor)